MAPLLVCWLVVSGGTAVTGSSGSEVLLVREGKAAASIVIAADANRAARFAA